MALSSSSPRVARSPSNDEYTQFMNEVLVNGMSATLDASGAFTADIPTVWGTNFVELSATDGVGNQATRTCTFLSSDTWVPESEMLTSGVTFKARQPVFDDGDRADGLDSLADIGYTVINSVGLRDQLDASFKQANPLKTLSCDSEVLSVCVLSSEVTYLDSNINGPNSISLTTVDGGFNNAASVNDIRIRIRLQGKTAGIPYDTTGWITFKNVQGNLTSDLTLSSGRPHVSVRPGSVSVDVGAISTDFSGLSGDLINIVVSLFNGRVRTLVANMFTNYLSDNLNSVFDSVVSGLDVHNLAANFSVPRLDDTSALSVDFATSFSTLNDSSDRMLASLGTQFQAVSANDIPAPGAPIPPGDRLLDVVTSQSLAVAVHDGVIDQALYALWRGGYFNVNLVGGDLDGLVPPGVSLKLVTMLPPTARLRDDGRLEFSVGTILSQIDDPELLAEPLSPRLSARGSCGLSLLGDALKLDTCRIEEFHLSVGSAPLDANTQASLELFLTGIMNQVLQTAVNDSLPVLPIPGIKLPSSLSYYGLPAGAEMGLVNPQLSTVGDHIVLTGDFGVR